MVITRNQWLAIAILASSILMGGASQLDVLIGPTASKSVVAAMILLNGFLAGTIVILGGQMYQIQDVRNLALQPGTVNGAAAQRALVEATSAIIGSSAAGPSVTKEAKVALLDATANLPEVSKDIIVNDKSLADATVSPQVRAG